MSVVVALWIAFKHTSCFAQELSSWECLWLYCNLEVHDVAVAALISLLPSPPHLGITEHGGSLLQNALMFSVYFHQ